MGESASDYYRQYSGYTAGGKRMIYVNGFWKRNVGMAPNWKEQALVYCDGGDELFGAEYDPAKKFLSHLAFNGTA